MDYKNYKAKIKASLRRREQRLKLQSTSSSVQIVRSMAAPKTPRMSTRWPIYLPVARDQPVKTSPGKKLCHAGDKKKNRTIVGPTFSRHDEIEKKFDQLNASGHIDNNTTGIRKRLTVDKHPEDPFKEINLKLNARMMFQPRTPSTNGLRIERYRVAIAKRQAEKLGINFCTQK